MIFKDNFASKITTRHVHSAFALLIVAMLLFGASKAYQGSLASLFLTPDQHGQRLFKQGQFAEAAEAFQDPLWKATSLYRAGEFKQAAGIFAGYDTPIAVFNHGNALCMQGLYEDAIPRYERALVLQSGWEEAHINLEVARAGAERLKREGGEGTGGKLGADDIEISHSPGKPSPGGQETVDAAQDFNDKDMRATWLRRVQTRPEDFLRAKFAYQASRQGEP